MGFCMGLVVTVSAYNGLPPRDPVSLCVRNEVQVLGRHPDCQLELPDPECSVSGRHALIAPAGDGYTITDISTNGTFLNDALEPIPANQPVGLNHGDRLSIGPYLLQVTLEQDSALAVTDPFATDPQAALPGLPHTSTTPDILELLDAGSNSAQSCDSSADEVEGSGLTSLNASPLLTDEQDRSAHSSSGPERQPPSVEQMHLGVPTMAPAPDAKSAPPQTTSEAPAETSPMDDPFARAALAKAPLPKENVQPTSAIPDDYDLLSDAFGPADVEQPRNPEPAFIPPEPVSGPDTHTSEVAQIEHSNNVIPAPDRDETSDADQATAMLPASGVAIGAPGDAQALPQAMPATATGRPIPASESIRQPAPADSTPLAAGASAELNAFLAGLGMQEIGAISDPEAMLRTSGQLLRIATEGMLAVMMARSSFKSELRLEVTTIRSRENNPFQFCADADDVLDRLLLRHARGFLEPTTAVEKTFEDIQAHQMAIIAGLRAALKALLARFDPALLEQQVDSDSGLQRLLPMARKSKCWDLFVATFDQVADDASEDFMRLFGDAFNRAYEEQIQRLRQVKQGNMN